MAVESVELFDGRGRYHDDEIDAVSIGFGACSRGYRSDWWLLQFAERTPSRRELYEERVVYG